MINYIRERYNTNPDGIDKSNNYIVNGSQQLEWELLPKVTLSERKLL